MKTTSVLYLLVALGLSATISSAYAEIDIGGSPDFPDPRTVPSVGLEYSDGHLVVTKVNQDSVIDLVLSKDSNVQYFAIATASNEVTFEPVTVYDTTTKQYVLKEGCYTAEERTEFTWQRSNKVCVYQGEFVTYEKWPNYADIRTFVPIEEYYTGELNYDDVQLIVLDNQSDMRFVNYCPQSYSENLVSCYKYSDGKKFIISSWETITKYAVEHELKHADCNCMFHD